MNTASLSKFLFKPTVPVLKINGSINKNLVQQVQKQLNSIKTSRAQSLALVINSHHGCPHETNILAQKIKYFVEQNHLNLHTFAESRALGSGYQLLSIGNEVYAQQGSIVGQTGCVTTLLNMKQFISNYGLKSINLTTNKNLNSHYTDTMVDRTNEIQNNIYDYQRTQNQLMVQDIIKNRNKKLNINESELIQNEYFGEEAKDKGLVDHIGSYQQVLMKLYPQAKLVQYTTQSKIQQFEDLIYLIIKIAQSEIQLIQNKTYLKMNSQTIQDSVNKYRYGVLIGNYNEETFGKDQVDRDFQSLTPNSTQKDTHNLYSTVYNVESQNIPLTEKEFQQLVKNQSADLPSHLLLGHGAIQNDFEKRQMTTSYDLSYNKIVKPQTQIHSKYEPQYTLSANLPKKEEVADKITNISASNTETLNQPKKFIHYDQFMKTFDATHIKIPLRK